VQDIAGTCLAEDPSSPITYKGSDAALLAAVAPWASLWLVRFSGDIICFQLRPLYFFEVWDPFNQLRAEFSFKLPLKLLKMVAGETENTLFPESQHSTSRQFPGTSFSQNQRKKPQQHHTGVGGGGMTVTRYLKNRSTN
jgi:hypothetical protein